MNQKPWNYSTGAPHMWSSNKSLNMFLQFGRGGLWYLGNQHRSSMRAKNEIVPYSSSITIRWSYMGDLLHWFFVSLYVFYICDEIYTTIFLPILSIDVVVFFIYSRYVCHVKKCELLPPFLRAMRACTRYQWKRILLHKFSQKRI